MINQLRSATDSEPGRPSLVWDVNTAFAAYVLAALFFLLLVRRGFRGFLA